MPNWTDEFSFINGCVVDSAFVFFLLSNDELAAQKIETAMFLGWKGGRWLNGGDQDWLCAGIAVDRSETPKLVAVGEFGQVFVKGGGVESQERVTPNLKSVSNRGPLRGVRTVEDAVYAVGMGQQVYMRSGGKWSAIDQGLRLAKKSPEIEGFEGVDGFDRNDICAVGWNGAICRFDGRNWRHIDSPTNMILNDVCCAADGNIYAVGQKGTLVMGSGEDWRLIDIPDQEEDLWGVAWHGDRLYFCSTSQLFTFDGKAVSEEDLSDHSAQTFYKLSSGDGVLCSIGAKDVLMHDGSKWIRLD